MVIEVKIKNDAEHIDESSTPPLVLVNKKILNMVQGEDGNWYGYFADRKMAEIADSSTSVRGEGLDFGGICSIDNARISILKQPKLISLKMPKELP